MKRLGLALVLVVTGSALVVAQEDPIKLRKAHFKEMGGALREPGGMLRGQVAFDLAKVQNALTVIASTAEKNVKLFPTAPTVGVETEALAVIWDKKAEFDALFVKLGNDARTAQGVIKDEATFKSEFPKVLGNCGACHNAFRLKT